MCSLCSCGGVAHEVESFEKVGMFFFLANLHSGGFGS